MPEKNTSNKDEITPSEGFGANTIIDGVFSLGKRIGTGGMAVVYLAKADLNRFDYTTLYAYSQVRGDTHTERLAKAAEFAEKLKQEELDIPTIRKVLIAQDIPVPADQVAVKVNRGEKTLPRFEGEWKHLLCLNHENVIKVYGGGVYQGRAYYAMEYIDTLCAPKRINKEFTIKQKLEIFIQACKGLQYLHDNGIIHRDVKPDNMMVSQQADGSFVTKISDLGIAKNVNEDLGLTVPNTVLGSPYYMSPEQIKSSSNVSCLTDIYSLGASLYEMVSGVSPYHDKTSIYQIINAVCFGTKPIPIKTHTPNLPDAIAGIIECAMCTEPAERYQSISDMQADLETYLQDENTDLTSSISFRLTDKASSAASIGSNHYCFESLVKTNVPLSNTQSSKTNITPHSTETPTKKLITPANIIIAGIATIILIIAITAAALFIKKPSPEATHKAISTRPPITPSATLEQVSPDTAYTQLNEALYKANPSYNGKLKINLLKNNSLEVNLNNCGLTDLPSMDGLNITKFHCCDNKLKDLSQLSKLPLVEITCSNNLLSDLASLANLQLQELFCGNNKIKNIAPLSNMPLKALYIQDNNITDLSPLKSKELKKLYCAKNPIEDITPLTGMQLEELCISPENIKKGWQALKTMNSLKILAANKFEWMTKQSPKTFIKRYIPGSKE